MIEKINTMGKTILTAILTVLATTFCAAQPRGTAIVAHRGYWNCKKAGYTPNSVAALKCAQKAGFWGSEFDINMTSDGEILVFHDGEINGKKIDQHPYSEFKLEFRVRMLIDLLSIDFPIVEYENLTVGGHVDVEFAAPESCFLGALQCCNRIRSVACFFAVPVAPVCNYCRASGLGRAKCRCQNGQYGGKYCFSHGIYFFDHDYWLFRFLIRQTAWTGYHEIAEIMVERLIFLIIGIFQRPKSFLPLIICQP